VRVAILKEDTKWITQLTNALQNRLSRENYILLLVSRAHNGNRERPSRCFGIAPSHVNHLTFSNIRQPRQFFKYKLNLLHYLILLLLDHLDQRRDSNAYTQIHRRSCQDNLRAFSTGTAAADQAGTFTFSFQLSNVIEHTSPLLMRTSRAD